MGSLVAFAFAAGCRDRVTRWVQMEAPIPGLGPWEQIIGNPRTWHFGFGGPDMERLVAGRERIYLDHFWNEFAGVPAAFGDKLRQHYAALYAQPGAMRAGFSQFNAFPQDAEDNRKSIEGGGKLASAGAWRRGGSGRAGGGDHAIRRRKCGRRRRSGFRTLADGGEPGGHIADRRQVPLLNRRSVRDTRALLYRRLLLATRQMLHLRELCAHLNQIAVTMRLRISCRPASHF